IRDRNVTGVQTCALPIWIIGMRLEIHLHAFVHSIKIILNFVLFHLIVVKYGNRLERGNCTLIEKSIILKHYLQYKYRRIPKDRSTEKRSVVNESRFSRDE